MLETAAILGMISIGISAVYLLKHKRETASEGEYIWVGPGENPFKRDD